jgi:hypothetical protein
MENAGMAAGKRRPPEFRQIIRQAITAAKANPNTTWIDQ